MPSKFKDGQKHGKINKFEFKDPAISEDVILEHFTQYDWNWGCLKDCVDISGSCTYFRFRLSLEKTRFLQILRLYTTNFQLVLTSFIEQYNQVVDIRPQQQELYED